MVTGSLFRMQRGHWNTTVANAWGVLAMKKFSAEFEKAPVTGATAATLDGAWFEHAWKPDDGTTPFHQLLPWPPQASPLKIAHADCAIEHQRDRIAPAHDRQALPPRRIRDRQVAQCHAPP